MIYIYTFFFSLGFCALYTNKMGRMSGDISCLNYPGSTVTLLNLLTSFFANANPKKSIDYVFKSNSRNALHSNVFLRPAIIYQYPSSCLKLPFLYKSNSVLPFSICVFVLRPRWPVMTLPSDILAELTPRSPDIDRTMEKNQHYQREQQWHDVWQVLFFSAALRRRELSQATFLPATMRQKIRTLCPSRGREKTTDSSHVAIGDSSGAHNWRQRQIG